MRYTDLFETTTQRSVRNCRRYIAPNGDINLAKKKITSLDGSPEICNGNFTCSDNKIRTLEGGPKVVKGSFDVSYCALESLDYFPEVGGGINVSYNSLGPDFIHHLPDHVKGPLNMAGNLLPTTANIPSKVDGLLHFAVDSYTFDGTPTQVNGNCIVNFGYFSSRVGRAEPDGTMSCKDFAKRFPVIRGQLSTTTIRSISHLLYLITIQGLTSIGINSSDQDTNNALKIVKQFVGQGRKGMMLAQAALIQNGYEKFAEM
jgi:hypothetical protein